MMTKASGRPRGDGRDSIDGAPRPPQEAIMKRVLGLLGVSGIALGAIWFTRTRRRGELPGFVTHRFNPLVTRFGLAGGRRSPWAILEHVGRTSGTTYRTPISLVTSPTADHVYVRLSYGPDVHWLKNVRAAGHCRVQVHETILELDEPAVVPASENLLVPPRVRAALERAGRQYLRLHILERVPGTFAHQPAARSGEPAHSFGPSLEMLHAEGTSPEPATA
jgi:deazaflavin-dependent oxidoreductase (nitroreductase family)